MLELWGEIEEGTSAEGAMIREAVLVEDRVRTEKGNTTRQHQTLPGLEKLRQGSLPVPGQPVSYGRVCLREKGRE